MNRAALLCRLVPLAGLAFSAPALARGPMVCLAASKPADFKKAIADVDTLEFYADEGDPPQSYSVPLTRVQSDPDAEGRLHNTYSVHNANAIGATIVFSGDTPLSFSIIELGRNYASLNKNDEETAFMADAAPGIACYTVTVESDPL